MEPASTETFQTARPPTDVLDAAALYLEGAGTIAPGLAGRLERKGGSLVVHHGRIETTVKAVKSKQGSEVTVTRDGQAPLESTRRWLYLLGLTAFIGAAGLSYYNDRVDEFLTPLVTMTIFFAGIMSVIVALYVVDRSLERRSESFVHGLRDAIDGDALLVLQRETDALERSSSIANGLLVYCGGLIIEFGIFAILLTGDLRSAIDEAAAIDTMRFGLLIPVPVALLFGLVYHAWKNRVHQERMAMVERHFGRHA